MDDCVEVQSGETKEVPEQLENLRVLLEEMDNCVVSLEEKLKPVLCTDLDPGACQEKVKERPLVPLADSIRERCSNTRNIIQRIRFIHRGLQI